MIRPRHPLPLRHCLVVETGPRAVRMLLLAEHASGRVAVYRARAWDAEAPVGEITAAIAIAYHGAAATAPVAVRHTHHGAPGTWARRLRVAVGPLAPLTCGPATAGKGWAGTVRDALIRLGIDPDDDPEHTEIVTELAATRATPSAGLFALPRTDVVRVDLSLS
jgi:hypothetical protein